MEQFADEIDAVNCDAKFIRAEYACRIYESIPLWSIYNKSFSFVPLKGLWEGFTVTYVCLQLAYWMGFETVLLVGVDHRYEYDGEPNEERVLQGDDPNHFHPDYFKGMKWHNPDLARSEDAYNLARIAFQAAGRRIINLTPNTGENAFEKGRLEDWND